MILTRPLIDTYLPLLSPISPISIIKTTTVTIAKSKYQKLLCWAQYLSVVPPLYWCTAHPILYSTTQVRYQSANFTTITITTSHITTCNHHPSPFHPNLLIDPWSYIHHNGGTGVKRCTACNAVLPQRCDTMDGRVIISLLIVLVPLLWCWYYDW